MSVYTLVILTGHRYFSIVHPVKAKQCLNVRLIQQALTVAFFFSMIFGMFAGMLPIVHEFSNTSTKKKMCTLEEDKRLMFLLADFTLGYVIPIVVIIFCYTSISLSLSQRSPFNLWGQYFTFVAVFLLHLFLSFLE